MNHLNFSTNISTEISTKNALRRGYPPESSRAETGEDTNSVSII
jgi:hypothetical protein